MTYTFIYVFLWFTNKFGVTRKANDRVGSKKSNMKNFKELSEKELGSIKGGEITIMGQGTDAGGNYVIVDNGTSCVKVYPGPGGHDEFPSVH